MCILSSAFASLFSCLSLVFGIGIGLPAFSSSASRKMELKQARPFKLPIFWVSSRYSPIKTRILPWCRTSCSWLMYIQLKFTDSSVNTYSSPFIGRKWTLSQNNSNKIPGVSFCLHPSSIPVMLRTSHSPHPPGNPRITLLYTGPRSLVFVPSQSYILSYNKLAYFNYSQISDGIHSDFWMRDFFSAKDPNWTNLSFEERTCQGMDAKEAHSANILCN